MRLYDTARRSLTEFKPTRHEVQIYVCGITPYDSAHLGHIFTFNAYDLIARHLIDEGHQVRLVRNITDVDEPIFVRAAENGEPYQALARRETEAFGRVMAQLNFLPPAAEPKASDYIGQMGEAARQLEVAGFAYRLDGDLYFDTARFARFGKLSHFPGPLMQKLAADRGGDPDRPGKRHRLDFLLFKHIQDHRDPAAWDTAAGFGRPGWHIECSVMSHQLLELPIDLHGGGMDLIFPHHEAEIAQSESLWPHPFARHFVHVAPLLRFGEKMSKSLGNLVFARDLLDQGEPAAVRLAMLFYHYRVGGEWCDDTWDEARRLAADLRTHLARNRPGASTDLAGKVRAALDNNLDTRAVIRLLYTHLYCHGDVTELRQTLELLGISL